MRVTSTLPLPSMVACIAFSTALAGCAGLTTSDDATPMEGASPAAFMAQPTEPAAAQQPVADESELLARKELANAIARYEAGQFADAIRLLQTSPGIWAASAETRTSAYKTLAFSHCVTNRLKACRESFDALLRVSPSFELTAAEAGHPQWGRVFLAAKAASARTTARR